MLNYTKGEWKINTRDRTLHEALRDDISIIVEHDDGSAFMVASQMDLADAQLIAAAPKMYEEIEATIEKLNEYLGEWVSVNELYSPEWTHAIKRIIYHLEQVLAKADGKGY